MWAAHSGVGESVGASVVSGASVVEGELVGSSVGLVVGSPVVGLEVGPVVGGRVHLPHALGQRFSTIPSSSCVEHGTARGTALHKL